MYTMYNWEGVGVVGAPTGSDSVCFEVLGFDVLVDKKLNPWLLEEGSIFFVI